MATKSMFSRLKTTANSALDFGTVAFMPALLPFFLFHLSVRFLPLWAQAIVSALLFVVLLAALRYLTGARIEKAIRAHYETRLMVWFPLAASVGTLVFSMYVFAAAQSVLVAARITTITPALPQTEWSRLTDLYLWHFLSSIPGFKIPDTLKWPVPYQYTDHITGVLILSFQVAVIAPVIKVFYVWAKVRRDFTQAPAKGWRRLQP